MDIYFFSGTGNSLFIAEEIKSKMDARLIPIAKVIDKPEIITPANVIGIVFPVYYADIPIIVKNFAQKLTDIQQKYIFAISNYGGSTGNSYKSLSNIFRGKGSELSAGFGIHMPQNAFRKPWKNYQRIYQKSRKRINFIIKKIQAREKGICHSNPILEWLTSPFVGMVKSMTEKAIAKAIEAPQSLGLEKLMLSFDKTYKTNDKCNGCGICEKVCPVDNIIMEEGNPVWQNHCENCLACYNWCPNTAIEGGPAQDGYYYRNAEMKASDIMKQK
jgi:ferredoxin/flavodoxin